MTKVFVPQVPSSFNKEMKTWVPNIKIDSASKFGEIIVMLPPNAAKAGPAPCVAAMREKLDEQFSEGDYILSIGSPSLFGALCVLAHQRSPSGVLRQLQWDRFVNDYVAVEVKL